jgi:hypothetical protein
VRLLTEIYVLQKSLGEIAAILMTAGKWRHSMCLDCFRKRWPSGKHSAWQVPEKLRVREICCFCLSKHKDGIHRKKDPRSQETKVRAADLKVWSGAAAYCPQENANKKAHSPRHEMARDHSRRS